MKKFHSINAPLPRLGDLVRPSVSINKEIVSATNALKLGDLFDSSFNARVGVLAKTNQEIDRLIKIAEKLIQVIPKEKLTYINFIIVDNRMDLQHEVFATHSDLENILSDEEIAELRKNTLLILSQVIQKGCTKYAHFKDKNWNKDELRNELEKMKEIIFRTVTEKHENIKKPDKPLLFTKKKEITSQADVTGNLIKTISEEDAKNDRAKILFTGTRARENSMPSELLKNMIEDGGRAYSFLDLLAADGIDSTDLEGFEQTVILKLETLKDHILNEFNPVFNELNAVRKRLQQLAQQSTKNRDDKKSIMKEIA